MSCRKAVFAGSWYPARASDCEKEIKSFLKETRFHIKPDRGYIGGVVPHAGWFFSGSLACNAISALRDREDQNPADAIVIFGMHLHPHSGAYITTEGSWETPFGNIDIETELARKLVEKFTFKIETPTHFTPDNTIELQAPFVKYFFPKSRILPIGVPPSGVALDIASSVADFASQLKIRIKIIGSTDLTHYGPNYGFLSAGAGAEGLSWAKNENDKKIIDVMLGMDPEMVIREGLSNSNACCSGAAAAAISASKSLGAKNSCLVGYSSSYEKSPGDSFVGYAGILFN
jgi:hypothetical protein